jgi:chromosome segregation ATPase
MADIQTLLVQVAIGTVPLGVAWLAFRSATDANKKTQQTALTTAERQAELERTKVDAEAYTRAKIIYEAALERLERQLDRVSEHSHKVSDELMKEQDTSLSLRSQIRTLQDQIARLERTVSELRRHLSSAGIDPAVRPISAMEEES